VKDTIFTKTTKFAFKSFRIIFLLNSNLHFLWKSIASLGDQGLLKRYLLYDLIMGKLKSILLLIFCLTSCKEQLDKEIVFFENIDFKSGVFKIYLFASDGPQIGDFHNFVIEDVETLELLKERWIFKNKISPIACGYGYNLKLVDDKKVVKSTNINVECEYMTGWIKFPKEYLSDFKHSFIKIDEIEIVRFSEKYIKQ